MTFASIARLAKVSFQARHGEPVPGQDLPFDSRWYRPAAIGSVVLVRLFEHRLEVRDLLSQALLRTHARAERPGTVVLPDEERIFNPSRETRCILGQAKEIGPATHKLCETMFAREGRVGQRKLWGIVGLTRRFPRRLIDIACERSMHEGVYS